MAHAANLGFPRIGAQRELKKIVERFWKGDADQAELEKTAKDIRAENWKRQKDSGIALIPSNDFSFYDQVLDHIQLFGVMPERYNPLANENALTQYFAMARGIQKDTADIVAMEMTKWFDTNYHYIVPEFSAGQSFSLAADAKPVREYKEAKEQGIDTRPVIIGPVSFLMMGKARDGSDTTDLLSNLLPAYINLLKALKEAGANSVQMDEPYLVRDLTDAQRDVFRTAYKELDASGHGLSVMIATYFDSLRDNTALACELPVDGLHIDLKRAPEQLERVLDHIGDEKTLSIGVVDGRNIWKADLAQAITVARKAEDKVGSMRLMIAPSCSLLHTPVDLSNEQKLDGEIKQWLAFAQQKLEEISVIARALNEGDDAVKAELEANAKAMEARRSSKRIHNDDVKQRRASVNEAMKSRASKFKDRIAKQNAALNLPPLATTTIGSFPQTQEVRKARATFKKGEMSTADYESFLKEQTTSCIREQEKIGLDVLVHGEFERNDMVEYFGEQLDGFCFTQNGWVQSYGSRCVKPPIIFGDVSRPKPMTIDWITYAQSQTEKLMKGMLTGPVTILQWSFVRDDQPESDTCMQIALAIRDEVVDLEKAGIKVIQIDEAALREGLPLRQSDWKSYLDWAVDAFRVAASGVKDETQIHTHMCYSEFNDIIEAVANMDADVISIETSRSAMELLDAFVEFKYPNQIGPGVYDIHSPRVPKKEEMVSLLNKALEVLSPEQTWVNPDCGLKTRGWDEVRPALEAMVSAANDVRSSNKAAA